MVNEDERVLGGNKMKLSFEAVERLSDDKQALLEGMIFKYKARRWTTAS